MTVCVFFSLPLLFHLGLSTFPQRRYLHDSLSVGVLPSRRSQSRRSMNSQNGSNQNDTNLMQGSGVEA